MLTVSIERSGTGMIFATSEDSPGIFVAVQTWDELWPALQFAVDAWFESAAVSLSEEGMK